MQGGIVGISRTFSEELRYTQNYGVWSIGESYKLRGDGFWDFNPPELVTYTNSTSDTDIHTIPSSVQIGDLILIVSADQGSNVGSVPSPFTELVRYNSTNPRTVVAYFIDDGTYAGIGGSLNINSDFNVVAVFRRSGGFGNMKFDVNGSLSYISSNSISASVTANYKGLLIATHTIDDKLASFTSIDGMTQVAQSVNDNTSNPVVTIFTQSSDSSAYTKTFTTSSIKGQCLCLLNIY